MELKRVKLKPNSPEFEDREEPSERVQGGQRCEMPGCNEAGTHKAPKSRGLNEYYYFCLKHVQEYNRAWNFFEGMAEQDIQDHLRNNVYGDRPTWRFASPGMDDHLRAQAQYFKDGSGAFSDSDDERFEEFSKRKQRDNEQFASGASSGTSGFYGEQRHTPEVEAMAIMGLHPPVTLADIKAQYKKLAKKYHPDLNRDDPEAEETLKKVNMAYTVLKLAYAEYEKHQQDQL